jgi:hypothetical protein
MGGVIRDVEKKKTTKSDIFILPTRPDRLALGFDH